MSTNYRFYGVNIDTPLSLANNTAQWNSLVLGQLSAKSNAQVYIVEIPHQYQSAEYCWRVVDAVYSQEDDVMSYFRAYDEDGNLLPEATFGIGYAGLLSTIAGGFKYSPVGGNRYYIPARNDFVTPNTGGYTVQVLDLEYPSEGMVFGMSKQDNQHTNLTISFRLFKLGKGYPNDMPKITPR